MRLFFLRHGIAEAGHSGLRDFDRQLTPEGRDELEAIARGLLRLRVTPKPILTSPYLRARQTADLVAPVLGTSLEVVDELQSGATFDAFQRLLRRYQGTECVMLVGHQPDLSEAIARLIGAEESALVLKKGGAARVDVDARLEPGRGRLRWLMTGSQLALLGAGDAETDADDDQER